MAVRGPDTLRVATINVEDLRSSDLSSPDHPRLLKFAKIVQELDADILLVNEIERDKLGYNGQLLADKFFNTLLPQAEHYKAFMPYTNTGKHSGLDLNNDGIVLETYPQPDSADQYGNAPRQTQEQRDYGNDTWGFGTFPGQYGMTLLVRAPLEFETSSTRTFQNFLWSDMPNAFAPGIPETKDNFYSEEEWSQFPLSSKNHADLVVISPSGHRVHILISHPTPPAFDGPEMRNKKRNHDEIRFWADYLNGESYMSDDNGTSGGFAGDAPYILLGDQNADPDEGSSFENPAKKYFLDSGLFQADFIPKADLQIRDLDADDTSQFGLRVDYVLPSMDLEILDGGILAKPFDEKYPASDHLPVWLKVVVGN